MTKNFNFSKKEKDNLFFANDKMDSYLFYIVCFKLSAIHFVTKYFSKNELQRHLHFKLRSKLVTSAVNYHMLLISIQERL